MLNRLDLLRQGRRYLSENETANPTGESEFCLTAILNCPRHHLYLDNLAVKETEARHFWRLLSLRAKGEPLQYLLGQSEFMGLTFKVRPGVFIPRPETELLVETALDILSNIPINKQTNRLTDKPTNRLKILDLGCGSGNIAISLAVLLKPKQARSPSLKLRRNLAEAQAKADIFACDISDSALQLTKENASLNKVVIEARKSNLFSAFARRNLFNLIVSNPPYIKAGELKGLSREVRAEPALALNGGRDGLFYYRRIIAAAPAYLQEQGFLALEIGAGLAAGVVKIISQSRYLKLVKVVKDYNGLDRIILAQKEKAIGNG